MRNCGRCAAAGDAPAHCDLSIVDAHARAPAQRRDDSDAGEDEDEDGNDGAKQALSPVVGDDEGVDAPQRRQFDVHVRRRVADGDADRPVAQRRRHGDRRHYHDHRARHRA